MYSAVIRRTKDGKPPIVKPAFYAYIMLQVRKADRYAHYAHYAIALLPASSLSSQTSQKRGEAVTVCVRWRVLPECFLAGCR